MEFRALLMYYKAAVMVPFFTMCFFLLVTCVADTLIDSMLKMSLFSGIMTILASGIFINRFKNISSHFIKSLLSFFLLPLLFFGFILRTQVDWRGLKYSNGNMVYNALLFVIFFVHFIGLAISFVDFRRSVVKTLEEENQTKNELRTIYDDQIPYA